MNCLDKLEQPQHATKAQAAESQTHQAAAHSSLSESVVPKLTALSCDSSPPIMPLRQSHTLETAVPAAIGAQRAVTEQVNILLREWREEVNLSMQRLSEDGIPVKHGQQEEQHQRLGRWIDYRSRQLEEALVLAETEVAALVNENEALRGQLAL